MADAPDDKTRIAIGQDYMSAVARMHSLPVEPFVAVGMHRPETAEDIALVGLHAYLPHYKRTKRKPEPLLEFVIGWRSEEHTSELQSLMRSSYAVFCLKKKK